MPTPRVSLCMMVKNEAATLRACLDSIVGIADELILVDTGSTDGTQDIIAEYQEARYHYEWDDDFAAARNYVASLATGDYICRWDADWILRDGDLSKLLAAKQAGFEGAHEVHAHWINEFHEESLAPRSMVTHMFLYRRELFEWYCAVPAHDMTRPLDPHLEVTQAVYLDIWVYHLKDPVEKAHRYDQTHRLIQKNLEKLEASHPDRIVNLQFYLSSCMFREEYPAALDTVHEMLIRVEPANPLRSYLLETEVLCLLHLQRLDEAYTRAFDSYRTHPDFRTILALADVVTLLEPTSAPELYREYLRAPRPEHDLNLNSERYRVHPLLMLGTLSGERESLQAALDLTHQDPTRERLLTALASLE